MRDWEDDDADGGSLCDPKTRIERARGRPSQPGARETARKRNARWVEGFRCENAMMRLTTRGFVC